MNEIAESPSPSAAAPPPVEDAIPVTFARPTTSTSGASFQCGEGIPAELVQDDLVGVDICNRVLDMYRQAYNHHKVTQILCLSTRIICFADLCF